MKFPEIDRTVAFAAHAGTSHTPADRAEQEIEAFRTGLEQSYKVLEQYATTGEKRLLLDREFLSYAEKLRDKTTAWLDARSKCLSPMITGPANFPVRRNEKANAVADRRIDELLQFRATATNDIRRLLEPEKEPIRAGDDDAIDRLAAKIAELETRQERMKAANKVIRSKKAKGPKEKALAVMACGFTEAQAVKILTPNCYGNIGFERSELTNNRANLRRLQKRLVKIQRDKSAVHKEIAGQFATYEDCPAENRIRLFFPGKPDAETRSTLKRSGFRWTPSIGCWQAYRNARADMVARDVAVVSADKEGK